MKLYRKSNTLSEHHIKADPAANQKVPDGLWQKCPKCQTALFMKQLDEYVTCPKCDYGFRISAQDRLKWLVDDFQPMYTDLQTSDPLDFPGYLDKIHQAQAKTGLNDSVATGRATINQTSFNLGIMDPTFIMGSLGSITGEKITRLFEDATQNQLPVVLFTASGGARMQEGITSLMQMAKVSSAIARHSEAGLLYIVVLTDPTTGGVTASFAMLGDVILAEPHAMVGFAGRRVIEQTMHEKIPATLQEAENVLDHGFIDRIVKRQDEKATLEWLIQNGGH